MKLQFVRNPKEIRGELLKGTKLVSISPGRLFGMFVWTKDESTTHAIYSDHRWAWAELGGTSVFFFPRMTRDEFLDYLRTLFPSLQIEAVSS